MAPGKGSGLGSHGHGSVGTEHNVACASNLSSAHSISRNRYSGFVWVAAGCSASLSLWGMKSRGIMCTAFLSWGISGTVMLS